MNEKELSQWKIDYRENSFYYRGKLIDSFNFLEKSIENYLILYFKLSEILGREFQTILLDRMTFQSKKESFATIMNNKAIEKGFTKTNNNSYPHSQLFKDIQEAQDERNCFAHYYSIVPIIENETIITLAEFRDSLKFHEYTETEFIDLNNKITSAGLEVIELMHNIA